MMAAQAAADHVLENRKQRKAEALKDHKFQKAKRWLLFGLSILGLGTAGAFTIRHFHRKKQAQKARRTGFEDASPSGLARTLRKAILGYGRLALGVGTDEVAIRSALTTVRSLQHWHKVIEAYRTMFGRDLVQDLEADLTTQELREMRLIISAKPRTDREAQGSLSSGQVSSWAERLNIAFDNGIFGTSYGKDLPAIYQITREIPSKRAFALVLQAYESRYGESLMDRLKAELSAAEAQSLLQMYHQKPN